MRIAFARDPHLGNLYLPELSRTTIYPGGRMRSAIREIGIFIAKQRRPVFREDGVLLRYETIWASVTHNERVDAGASQQAKQVFGGGASPAAPSATVYPLAIAVANATLTKAKTDLSLGSITASVTTNEFTTLGLSRVAATTPVGGDYTLPGALGGTFTQNLKKTFTASGNATAVGAGVFDSATVAGSTLFVEDNFASNAILVNLDTLTVTAAISN